MLLVIARAARVSAPCTPLLYVLRVRCFIGLAACAASAPRAHVVDKEHGGAAVARGGGGRMVAGGGGVGSGATAAVAAAAAANAAAAAAAATAASVASSGIGDAAATAIGDAAATAAAPHLEDSRSRARSVVLRKRHPGVSIVDPEADDIYVCLDWIGLVCRFGLVWDYVFSFGLVWVGLAWYCLVCFGLAWSSLIQFGLVWFSRKSRQRLRRKGSFAPACPSVPFSAK